MSIFSKTMGLVDRADIICLADGVDLIGGYLVDQATGARHHVKPLARPAIRMLRKPILCRIWISKCGWLDIEQKSSILIFIDDIGGLNVSRDLPEAIKVWILRGGYYLKQVKLKIAAKRFRSNTLGIFWGVSWGMMPLCALVTVVMAGAYGLGLPNDIYNKYFIDGQLVMLVSIWISMFIHELVHYIFAKQFSSHSQLVVRLLRVGLLHKQLPFSQEIKSAFIGPLVGFGFCLVMAAVASAIGEEYFYRVTIISVGLFHIASWWPSYGDGQTLLKVLRIRKNHATTTSNNNAG